MSENNKISPFPFIVDRGQSGANTWALVPKQDTSKGGNITVGAGLEEERTQSKSGLVQFGKRSEGIGNKYRAWRNRFITSILLAGKYERTCLPVLSSDNFFSYFDPDTLTFTLFRNKNTSVEWFKTACLVFWSNKDSKDVFKIAF